jgi:hypothetical protein
LNVRTFVPEPGQFHRVLWPVFQHLTPISTLGTDPDIALIHTFPEFAMSTKTYPSKSLPFDYRRRKFVKLESLASVWTVRRLDKTTRIERRLVW